MPHRLAEHCGQDALGRPLDELQCEGPADAVADEQELLDSEMVHQCQLVVGERPPRVVDLHWAGGFSAYGVALIHGNDTEVVLEYLHRIEHLARPVFDLGVQASARSRQKRDTGADFLVSDCDIAVCDMRHCSSSLMMQETNLQDDCNLGNRGVKTDVT